MRLQVFGLLVIQNIVSSDLVVSVQCQQCIPLADKPLDLAYRIRKMEILGESVQVYQELRDQSLPWRSRGSKIRLTWLSSSETHEQPFLFLSTPMLCERGLERVCTLASLDFLIPRYSHASQHGDVSFFPQIATTLATCPTARKGQTHMLQDLHLPFRIEAGGAALTHLRLGTPPRGATRSSWISQSTKNW